MTLNNKINFTQEILIALQAFFKNLDDFNN